MNKCRIILLDKKIIIKCCIGVVLATVYAIVITLIPLASKYLINTALLSESYDKVGIGLAIFISISIIQPITFYIKEILFCQLSARITCQIRCRMFEKMGKLPIASIFSIGYGEIHSRIMTDAENYSKFICLILNIILSDALITVLITVSMFMENILITIVSLISYGVFACVSFKMSKTLRQRSKDVLEQTDIGSNYIKHMYDSMLTIKLFALEDIYYKDSIDKFNMIEKTNVIRDVCSGRINAVSMSFTVLALAFIYGTGAMLILEGTMSIGGVIAMGLYFQSLIPPLSNIIKLNMNYNKIRPSIARLKEVFLMEEEGGNIIDFGSPKICFDNVNFSYQEGAKVLDGFSFNIEDFGLYLLVGESGSGKSTIAKLMCALYTPTSGSLRLFNHDITDLNKKELRKQVIYVDQKVDLLPNTLYENLVMDKVVKNETFEYICNTLKIDELANSLPDKMNTRLTSGVDLSEGEKKRIMIGRALMRDAYIYIFDEPEASLNHDYYPVLNNLFNELAHHHIVIIATHNREIYTGYKNIVQIKKVAAEHD